MSKWLINIAGAVIAGLIVWIVTQGPFAMAPQETDPFEQKIPKEGFLQIRCHANPSVITQERPTEIRVKIFSEENIPIPDVNIRLEVGGGVFPETGNTVVMGQTDSQGHFCTVWLSPRPATSTYIIGVEAFKEGFPKAKTQCEISIQYE